MQRMFVGLVVVLAAAGCRKDWDAQDLDGDGVSAQEGDCGPGDPEVGPAMAELCDGRDNNCDGDIDEGLGTPWFVDGDGDGFGGAAAATSCFAPAGSAAQDGDCDDEDAAVNPAARELCTDELDWNCDGVAGATDGDEDGVAACEDCDDDDDSSYPGAAELCDDVDNNCDGAVDDDPTDGTPYYVDLDGDGFGSDRVVVEACAAPEGFVDAAKDCDDLSATSFPLAPELCDGLDNDCNDEIDDGATGTQIYWADSDKDGFGDPTGDVDACVRPAGYVDNDADCDDADAAYNPLAKESCSDPTDYNCDGAVGQTDGDGDGTPACSDCDDSDPTVEPNAPEICDGIDNDCDGATDETAPTWYADLDADGHGGKALTTVACTAPGGFLASSDDCADLDPAVHPGAVEACNAVDDNCDGSTGLGEVDGDGDGFLVCEGDCNDASAVVSPVAREVCNGADDDCDSSIDENSAVDAQTWFVDADNDGYGTTASTTEACSAPSGFAANDRDCDDTSSASKPGGVEVCGGKDEDCDGDVDEPSASNATLWYADGDGDGSGSAVSTRSCSAPAGFVAVSGDCDDGDKARPGTEVCNGIDDDCNGALPANELDVDKDGYLACRECDDSKAAIFPGAPELCNGKDDDCNGVLDDGAVDAGRWYRDADNDKFGVFTQVTSACSTPSGYVAAPGDCNDGDVTIYPAALEVCDAKDHNCDGAIDFDNDGDLIPAAFCGGKDCDDDNPSLPDKSGVCALASCDAWRASGVSTSGTQLIDPDGSGVIPAYTAFCDQVADAGGWTRFWWHNSGDVIAAADVLGANAWSCAISASGCYASIPVSAPSELLVKHGDGRWAVWNLNDPSNTAVRARAAFVSRTQTPYNTGANAQLWNPLRTGGGLASYTCGSGCDSFWYGSFNGKVSIDLDDDGGWDCTAFTAGYDNSSTLGVDAFDGCAGNIPNSVNRGLEFYWR